jgi:hypothetical protein
MLILSKLNIRCSTLSIPLRSTTTTNKLGFPG